jgi:predicted CoA-binding protein
MTALDNLADVFFRKERFAITGVSRKGESAANFIWETFLKYGLHTDAVNPKAESIAGKPCFHSLSALPQAPEAVVIAGPAHATAATVKECIALGVSMIWMHRALDAGSVDDDAVLDARLHGITVIDGACPMMYLKPVDFAHSCFKWWMKLRGTLPKPETLHETVA